jgi:hypothetical protein
MLRHRLDVLLALRDGTDPALLPVAAANATGDYWERVGTLARGGHLNRKVIDNPNCQLWWATLAPNVRKVRAEWGDPKIGEDFEWLAAEMAEMNRRESSEIIPYAEMLGAKLEGRITATRDAIRVEQALRTFILASPEAVTVAPPAPAAPPA